MISRLKGHAQLLKQWQDTAGIGPAMSWELLKLGNKLGFPQPPLWRVKPSQVDHELAVRLPGSSDFDVFRQIFILEEYAAMRDIEGIEVVIDLGANVGYASAYFLSCFPECRVLAVEPDSLNYAQCVSNLAPYGARVDLLLGAAWSSCGRLSVERGVYGDGLDWSTQVRQTLSGDALPAVDGFDMPALIAKAGGMPVDILKVDIEGAERELFGAGAAEWLGKINNLCIELHGGECERIFFAALADFDYESSRSGELTICRGIRRARRS